MRRRGLEGNEARCITKFSKKKRLFATKRSFTKLSFTKPVKKMPPPTAGLYQRYLGIGFEITFLDNDNLV